MTQNNILKAAFDRGEELTVAVALQRYGVYALSQRCGELSRSGYPLDSETITLPSGKHVKQYHKLKVAYG
jgi:hypothetical protein